LALSNVAFAANSATGGLAGAYSGPGHPPPPCGSPAGEPYCTSPCGQNGQGKGGAIFISTNGSANGVAVFTRNQASDAGTTPTDNTCVYGSYFPALLMDVKRLSDGLFQFSYTNSSAQIGSIYASTNLSDWDAIGVATQIAPGVYRFTDTAATNYTRRFYQLQLGSPCGGP